MAQEYSLNQVYQIFKSFADNSSVIRGFYTGEYDAYNNPNKLYPLLWVKFQGAENKRNELVYNFDLVLVDRVESSTSEEQIKEVTSDSLRTLLDLKAWLTNARSYEILVDEPANFGHITEDFNDDIVYGIIMNGLKIRTAWLADICSIPNSLPVFAFENGVQGTSQINYLTCSNVLSCEALASRLNTYQTISGNTSSSYTFSAGTNLEVIVSGSNITYSLADNLNVNSINASNITSGNTNLNSLFATATQLDETNSNITNIEGDITLLDERINTKADTSGNTFFTSTYIFSDYLYSGGTPLSVILKNEKDNFTNTDNNIELTTGGTTNRNININLKDNVAIKYLTIGSQLSANTISGYIKNSTFDLTGTTFNNLNLINSNSIYSGGTDLNLLFATTSQLNAANSNITTNTNNITLINSQLNTKANTSGNTSFSASSISATTFYSGSTPLANIVLLTGQTDFSAYRKIGSNLTRWYTGAMNAVNNSTVAFAKDTIHYNPFIVSVTQTISLIAIEVTATGSTNSVARLGIYNSVTDKTSNYHMQPNQVIYDAGTVAIDSTGVKSISGLNVVLQPGLYYLAMNHNSSTTPTFRALGQAACSPLFSLSTTIGTTNSTHLIEAVTFGSFTSSVQNNVNATSLLIPIIAVQISA